MNKHHIFDQYQEFIIFLLIHVGNSDFSLKGAEIEVILAKMEDYFPDIDDMDELRNEFVNIQDEYEELNDSDINHLIYHNYLNFRDKQINAVRILNDLQEVIMADGLIHERETKTFESIKKLLDIREN
ncbi:TerB family tellurite resistance protein [Marivirga sp. S37H4]|uniref:TerB family tellurite resistance protein n=1 Tax=Marivirga aurantiaca TaxID=2802615 RepID=A0A935C9Z2_9BACT|nr:TerB family tellurite resistance protein [Marivirga aurantiaca]MBK6266244.1 TerB family tellurite resistance protein [Marivirga aurantiaca]